MYDCRIILLPEAARIWSYMSVHISFIIITNNLVLSMIDTKNLLG